MLSSLESHTAPLIALVLLALVSLARAGIRDAQHRRELRNALGLFALFLAAHGVEHVLEFADLDDAARWTRAISYVLFAFAALRASTSLAIWASRTRRGRITPKILRDVIDAVLYLAALSIVLRATLKVDLGGLLATSAILSVVIGLALQETLGNLFAGLALQIDPPYGVGDWISVGPHIGKVQQIAWRQTRILTARDEHVVLPNSLVAKECVLNYGRAGAGVARDLYLEVDYDSPPNAVKQSCLEVLAAHPKVRKSPPPLFRVVKFEASGIQYQLRFSLDSFDDADDLTNELLSLLWYRLRREGFSVPFPTRTVHLHQAAGTEAREGAQRDLASLLASVDFLRPLGEAGLARLVALSKMQLFGRDEVVLRQGDAGESFYLIVAGEVAVHSAEAKQEVARLRRGEFFGEMSLLTGEPRAATVIASQDSTLLCVDRGAFGEILKAHEELARALSQALAERTANLKARAAGAADAASSVTLESNRIFARLRDIFRLR